MERAREAGAYAGRAHRLPPWKKERRAHDRHISDVLGNQVVVGLQRARCEARPLGREVCLTVSDVGGAVVACPLHHGVRHVIGVVGRPCNHISQNCPRKSSCAADGCVVTRRIIEHRRRQALLAEVLLGDNALEAVVTEALIAGGHGKEGAARDRRLVQRDTRDAGDSQTRCVDHGSDVFGWRKVERGCGACRLVGRLWRAGDSPEWRHRCGRTGERRYVSGGRYGAFWGFWWDAKHKRG